MANKMKRRFVILPLVIAVMGVWLLMSCASSGGTKAVIDKSIVAGNGGTNVKVSYDRLHSYAKIDVFVDDFIYLTLSVGKKGQFVVPDGEHSIYAIETGFVPIYATTKLQFTAASSEMSFIVFEIDNDSGSGIDIKQNN